MKSADEIKKFFKSAAIDTNPKMDEAVLNKVLIANEKTTNPNSAAIVQNLGRIIMKNQITKLAAVVAVVLGLGAIAVVGVNISKIYYYGKTDDGAHIFISDDLETVVTTHEVTDVEQKVRDLEEMKILRQQDKRELLKVEEILRDGTIAWKVHEYKYELSDGRTTDMREGGDGTPVYSQDQFKEFKPKLEEFRQLKKAGQGEDLGTYEQTIKGRVFSFKREKYLLGDGTEFIWSVGRPKQDQ
jgi:hypothetical protein